MKISTVRDKWDVIYWNGTIGIFETDIFLITIEPEGKDDYAILERVEIRYHVDEPDKEFEELLKEKIHEETHFYYTSYSFRWYNENQILVNVGYPIMTI